MVVGPLEEDNFHSSLFLPRANAELLLLTSPEAAGLGHERGDGSYLRNSGFRVLVLLPALRLHEASLCSLLQCFSLPTDLQSVSDSDFTCC